MRHATLLLPLLLAIVLFQGCKSLDEKSDKPLTDQQLKQAQAYIEQNRASGAPVPVSSADIARMQGQGRPVTIRQLMNDSPELKKYARQKVAEAKEKEREAKAVADQPPREVRTQRYLGNGLR